MKVHYECFECGARKTKERIEKSTKDLKLRMKCSKSFLKLMAREFKEDANPSYLGTLQVKMVKRITKNKDPFKNEKKKAREKIMQVAKIFKKRIKKIKDEKKRFIEIVRVATIANSTEIMAPYKEFRIKGINLSNQVFGIDNSSELYEKIKRLKREDKILFLTDNYAESVFDKILIDEIKKITNARIVIGSSKEAIDDDLTLEDAKRLFGNKRIKFVNTGNSFGILWEKAPKGILKEIKEAKLIIAKGLANFETLTERIDKIKGKTFLLLTVKCTPVARELKLDVGQHVIMFVNVR